MVTRSLKKKRNTEKKRTGAKKSGLEASFKIAADFQLKARNWQMKPSKIQTVAIVKIDGASWKTS